MSHGRRSSDRRRRVLYTTHHADPTQTTAAGRRAAEQLREARRPTAAYGVRVKRRLRGRWFSLVPVRRRTLTLVSGGLVATALLLCFLHYASVSWAWLAYRPGLARPLRLDRADSFGRWMTNALWTASAGTSLLIYQLRRYRIDDYQGHYRLWRLVLLVLVLASVNSVVSLVDWCGAVLDASFGRRVALTGADWIRLVVSIGTAILGLRLIAEVRRSRWSLGWMLLGGTLLAIPQAANWNVMNLESIWTWTAVTSAPLLGATALLIALGGYLRMLYREVRQIEENDSLAQRVQQMRVRWFTRDETEQEDEPETVTSRRRRNSPTDASEETEEVEERPRKRRWWQRSGDDRDEPGEESQADEPIKRVAVNDKDDAGEEDADKDDAQPKPARRWFGLRKAKAAGDETGDVSDSEDSETAGLSRQPQGGNPSRRVRNDSGSRQQRGDRNSHQERDTPDEAVPAKKRRRFSLRLAPPKSENAEDTSGKESKRDKKSERKRRSRGEATDPSEESAEPTKKRGLGGWFRNKKSEDPAPAEEKPVDSKRETPPTRRPEPAAQSDDDDLDPENIDWDSLSKSERRRLRKKLRRQGRAA